MLQPLVELLSSHGVSSFTLQVSGTSDRTQVIVSPTLSAPAALPQAKGYSEQNEAYRAALTSPLVVTAPIGEIDTALADAINRYTQQLDGVLSDANISSLLSSAAALAQSTVAAKDKDKTKTKAKANDQNAAYASQPEPSQAPADNPKDDDGDYDQDVLASLGL